MLLRHFFITALAVLLAPLAGAEPLTVTVVDVNGKPVSGVAVFVEGGSAEVDSDQPRTAVMDQVDSQFVPQLLVVSKGTAVEFPNSDPIAHHVYSFSKPNDFVLPLYKGDLNKPVFFNHDGVVTVGCNIHDHMVGYIVVVEGETYGVTDSGGQVRFDSLDGTTAVSLQIWSPRIRDRKLTFVTREAHVTLQLAKKLRPGPTQRLQSAWSDY